MDTLSLTSINDTQLGYTKFIVFWPEEKKCSYQDKYRAVWCPSLCLRGSDVVNRNQLPANASSSSCRYSGESKRQCPVWVWTCGNRSVILRPEVGSQCATWSERKLASGNRLHLCCTRTRWLDRTCSPSLAFPSQNRIATLMRNINYRVHGYNLKKILSSFFRNHCRRLFFKTLQMPEKWLILY